MTKLSVAVGRRYGTLTVLAEGHGRLYPSQIRRGKRVGNRVAECVCDCGKRATVLMAHLASGHTTSCGCKASATTAARNRKHDACQTGHYARWYAMMGRCEDPRSRAYPFYGGRGIRVCEQWREPAVFAAWLIENLGPCPEDWSLDRINVEGDYEPGNVRWAPLSLQGHNKRKRRGCSSRYIGVSWHKATKRWRASIRQGSRQVSLGYFHDEVEAACAYDAAASKYWGASAKTNFTVQPPRSYIDRR